jgi:hypothetical protein
MLARAERQVEMNGIDKLGPLQNQVTTLDGRPKIVLNNLRQHAMRSR